MTTRVNLCLLSPVVFLSIWTVSLAGGISGGDTPTVSMSTDRAWQDPFYSGPFGIRVWTDVAGDHRVEGRFVELLPGEVVRLQRRDGRFLQIRFERLSRSDRELVRQITAFSE